MNFSKFDMVLLVTMSVAIVVMSFVFPALGLADAGTSESEVPEFSMNSDRFDFAGDFPSRQADTPTTGTLDFDTSEPAGFSDNQIWLHGSTDPAGAELNLIQNGSDPDAQVNLLGWDNGSVVAQDNTTLGAVGEKSLLEISESLGGYKVVVEMETFDNISGGYYYEVSYEIQESPPVDSGDDNGWLERLPIIGGLYSAGETVASVLAWGISVVWWFVTSTWEIALNVLGMAFDIVSFVFNTVSWLASTYGTILSAADSWVAIFVALPGLLLSLEFAKLAMIAISLLPFT